MAAPNRLAREKSPYLLSHARNPVGWYPWGEEAFAAARGRDVPLFVSIGYSACHWCHVMERECFEDADVARLMNEHLVPVKVDREELPAVDHLFMAFCQGLTGGGGWPLTVVLTPAGKPFFAGTYFPKESGFGRPGMMELAPLLGRLWREQREQVLRTAGDLERALAAQVRPAPGQLPGREEDGERPAAAAPEQLHHALVELIQVGALFAVDLHRDEAVVHLAGDGGVLEALALHHVAPVASRVADRQENRPIEAPGKLERLAGPGVPVDRVAGVGEQIRALLAGQPV